MFPDKVISNHNMTDLNLNFFLLLNDKFISLEISVFNPSAEKICCKSFSASFVGKMSLSLKKRKQYFFLASGELETRELGLYYIDPSFLSSQRTGKDRQLFTNFCRNY